MHIAKTARRFAREAAAGTVLLLAAMPALPVHGQPPGSAFLSISPSPRSYALGGTDTIVAEGAQALGANPANLGRGAAPDEVFAAHQILIGGSQYDHIAAVFSPAFLPGSLESVGVAVTRLSVGAIPGADALGNKTGDSFSAEDTAVTAGASVRLDGGLRLGADVKALKSQIGGYNSSVGLAADLGARYVFRGLTVAAGITNAGEGVRFVGQRDPLPTAVSAGISMPVGSSLDLVAAVSREIYAQTTDLRAGVEWGVGPAALRAGYSYSAGSPANLALADQSGAQRILGGLSGGFGVRWHGVEFAYAISLQAVDYGATQRVGLSYAWGGRAPRKADTSLEPEHPSMMMLGAN
jgi:hypothetical protein